MLVRLQTESCSRLQVARALQNRATNRKVPMWVEARRGGYRKPSASTCWKPCDRMIQATAAAVAVAAGPVGLLKVQSDPKRACPEHGFNTTFREDVEGCRRGSRRHKQNKVSTYAAAPGCGCVRYHHPAQ